MISTQLRCLPLCEPWGTFVLSPGLFVQDFGGPPGVCYFVIHTGLHLFFVLPIILPTAERIASEN